MGEAFRDERLTFSRVNTKNKQDISSLKECSAPLSKFVKLFEFKIAVYFLTHLEVMDKDVASMILRTCSNEGIFESKTKKSDTGKTFRNFKHITLKTKN